MDANFKQKTDAGAARKKKASADAAARKRRGGDARGRGLSPAAPPADAGRGAALAECAAACCVLCSCLPVAVLCCVARAPLRVARRCCRWMRRRPPRRLAPGWSSSFSDAELGDFRQGRRRAMADEEERPRARLPRVGRTAPPPAPPQQQQPPPGDRRG